MNLDGKEKWKFMVSILDRQEELISIMEIVLISMLEEILIH